MRVVTWSGSVQAKQSSSIIKNWDTEQGRYQENLLSNDQGPRELMQTTTARYHCACTTFRIKLHCGLASTDLQMFPIYECLATLLLGLNLSYKIESNIGSVETFTRNWNLGHSLSSSLFGCKCFTLWKKLLFSKSTLPIHIEIANSPVPCKITIFFFRFIGTSDRFLFIILSERCKDLPFWQCEMNCYVLVQCNKQHYELLWKPCLVFFHDLSY